MHIVMAKCFIHDEFLSTNCDCRNVHDNKFQNYDCINAQDKSKWNTHGEKNGHHNWY